jgi:hypothetical protein
MTYNFWVEENDSKQELLNRWIEHVRRNENQPWPQIARKMSLRADDYEWFTGTDDPLQFPWYDCEAITFKDPPRSSTEPVIDDEDEEQEGPSFGPGAGGPSGSQMHVTSGPSPSGNLITAAGSTTTAGGAGTHSDAVDYTTNTVHVDAGKTVDITFMCEGRTIVTSVKNDLKESQIQRLVANVLRMNLNGYWVATVTEGMGRI